jgi:hypothetical protein
LSHGSEFLVRVPVRSPGGGATVNRT